MIVVDASVVLDYLLDAGERGERARAVGRDGRRVHAPELLDVEVLGGIRGLVRGGRVSVARASAAVDDLADLRVTRWPHRVLMPRIWALRDVVTAYDAAYLSLADILDAPLVTADARLAAAAHGVRVESLPG